MSIVSSTHIKKKQILAKYYYEKCNVEIKIKKDMLQQNGRVKQMRGSAGMTWCAKTERIKKAQRDDSNSSSSYTGAVAVSWFPFNSQHIFTCSGGEFCPGLGEEELEVAAAGLVGLCCFAKREQEISLN